MKLKEMINEAIDRLEQQIGYTEDQICEITKFDELRYYRIVIQVNDSSNQRNWYDFYFKKEEQDGKENTY